MARRYVPRTYNNRRFLRLLVGGLTVLALAFVILFLIIFFTFQRYVVDGQLIIPWLAEDTDVPVATAAPDTDGADGADDADGGDDDAEDGEE